MSTSHLSFVWAGPSCDSGMRPTMTSPNVVCAGRFRESVHSMLDRWVPIVGWEWRHCSSRPSCALAGYSCHSSVWHLSSISDGTTGSAPFSSCGYRNMRNRYMTMPPRGCVIELLDPHIPPDIFPRQMKQARDVRLAIGTGVSSLRGSLCRPACHRDLYRGSGSF